MACLHLSAESAQSSAACNVSRGAEGGCRLVTQWSALHRSAVPSWLVSCPQLRPLTCWWRSERAVSTDCHRELQAAAGLTLRA